MKDRKVLEELENEIFYFIFKRAKQESDTKDIFQNTCLKVYENSYQIKDEHKIRAWSFQIARNEIANYYNQESKYIQSQSKQRNYKSEKEQEICCPDDFCCFEKFISELPGIYREIIELVYIQEKKQIETAEILNISLPNVKARIRRAKAILKTKFQECCHYEIDKNGKLTGEPNCIRCNSILKEH